MNLGNGLGWLGLVLMRDDGNEGWMIPRDDTYTWICVVIFDLDMEGI